MVRAKNQRRHSRVVSQVLLLILGTAACSVGERAAEARVNSAGTPIVPVMRVDSGMTVMEHPPTAYSQAPQWTLEPTPLTTIGGTDGDPQFDLTWASYVVPLSDGRVMTFARVGSKVLLFDRNGKGVRTIGRQGQGPGDWMNFGDPVLLAGDTVLVLDFANNRLNWVTAEGGIVRTAPFTVTGDMRRTRNISGFLLTGELVMHSAGWSGGHQTDSLQRSLAPVLTANLTTGQSRMIAILPTCRVSSSKPDFAVGHELNGTGSGLAGTRSSSPGIP